MNSEQNAAIGKYAVYLRKSRADRDVAEQTVEEVLARHKQILLNLAVQKGLYIAEIYEEVVSGETIKDRPEIQRLISDCYEGKYVGVLVVEITRLSRGNQGDAQTIIDCFQYSNNNNGVLVITPTKTYDIAHNSDDLEYMEFELFMSRREYAMIKKRMDRGKKQAIVEGNYMATYRPYGWKVVKEKKTRTLEPYEPEYSVVKMMYEWRVKYRMSPYKIACRLTDMGIPTYRGVSEWSKESVKAIIQNPVNMGKVRWNDRMQVKTMVNGDLVVTRPRTNYSDKYMLYEGKHVQMIDKETWMEANKGFKIDKTKSNLKLTNPLAGILVCKKCGRSMHYQNYVKKKGNVQNRYTHQPAQLCKVKSVMASDVMDAVVNALKLYIEDFEIKVDNVPDVDEQSLTGQISALYDEERKTQAKLSKLFDAWENGSITDNEFVERKAVNNARIESIKHQIRELENSMPEKQEYSEKIVLLSDALDALLDQSVDAADKNYYLKQIVEKIEYSRENEEEFILDVFLK